MPNPRCDQRRPALRLVDPTTPFAPVTIREATWPGATRLASTELISIEDAARYSGADLSAFPGTAPPSARDIQPARAAFLPVDPRRLVNDERRTLRLAALAFTVVFVTIIAAAALYEVFRRPPPTPPHLLAKGNRLAAVLVLP